MPKQFLVQGEVIFRFATIVEADDEDDAETKIEEMDVATLATDMLDEKDVDIEDVNEVKD